MIQPDLIALDIIMPEIDGFVAMQMLQADPRTKDIPVMFATNMGESADIQKGIALGAVDYTDEALMNRIKNKSYLAHRERLAQER